MPLYVMSKSKGKENLMFIADFLFSTKIKGVVHLQILSFLFNLNSNILFLVEQSLIIV